MKHWYFFIHCGQCKAKIPIVYLGAGESMPRAPQVPAVFKIACHTCGHVGDYAPGDLRAGPLAEQIAGFINLISTVD